MADHEDRKEWGIPGLTKETLDEYWEELLEKAKMNSKEEIHFFYHCTSIKAKADIVENGVILGSPTDMPVFSPLASYKGLIGTWFAVSSRELPSKSPYGSQRALFKVNEFMTYLSTEIKEPEVYDHENRWDAPEELESRSKHKAGGVKTSKKVRDKKKKERPINLRQKECYLKHKLPKPEEEPVLTDPQLFFECAYYYGNTQYIRLLLVRAADPLAIWCEEMCKEIDLFHNPFLQYKNGRIWTRRKGKLTNQSDVTVDVKVVGNIDLTLMPNKPEWDTVSKNMRRAGADPELGIC